MKPPPPPPGVELPPPPVLSREGIPLRREEGVWRCSDAAAEAGLAALLGLGAGAEEASAEALPPTGSPSGLPGVLRSQACSMGGGEEDAGLVGPMPMQHARKDQVVFLLPPLPGPPSAPPGMPSRAAGDTALGAYGAADAPPPRALRLTGTAEVVTGECALSAGPEEDAGAARGLLSSALALVSLPCAGLCVNCWRPCLSDWCKSAASAAGTSSLDAVAGTWGEMGGREEPGRAAFIATKLSYRGATEWRSATAERALALPLPCVGTRRFQNAKQTQTTRKLNPTDDRS